MGNLIKKGVGGDLVQKSDTEIVFKKDASFLKSLFYSKRKITIGKKGDRGFINVIHIYNNGDTLFLSGLDSDIKSNAMHFIRLKKAIEGIAVESKVKFIVAENVGNERLAKFLTNNGFIKASEELIKKVNSIIGEITEIRYSDYRKKI